MDGHTEWHGPRGRTYRDGSDIGRIRAAFEADRPPGGNWHVADFDYAWAAAARGSFYEPAAHALYESAGFADCALAEGWRKHVAP